MIARSEQEINAHVMRSMFSGTIHNMGNILTMASLTLGELEDANTAGSPPLLDMVLDEILPALESQVAMGTVGDFLTNDPRGSQMLQGMRELLDYQRNVLRRQRATMEALADKLNHLNGIISLQQQLLVGMGTTERTDIDSIIDDALKMIGPTATRQGIDIVRKLGKTTPILADPSAFTQVVINLIKNAIEAFEDGDTHDRKQITIITGNQQLEDLRLVTCSIKDNGPGMCADVAERAFEFGYTTKRRSRGERGIGLHFCRDTIEAFGGSLEVESAPGQGATFTIWLPSASTDADAHVVHARTDCNR